MFFWAICSEIGLSPGLEIAADTRDPQISRCRSCVRIYYSDPYAAESCWKFTQERTHAPLLELPTWPSSKVTSDVWPFASHARRLHCTNNQRGSSANSGIPVELRARETASGNAPRNEKTRESKQRRRGPCILRGAGVVTNHWGGSLVPIREKEAMGEQRGLAVTRSTPWERTFCGEGDLPPRPT